MPLFPNLADQYYDDKDKSLISRMEDFYADSVTLNQQYWAEADVDTRFYCGDQTVWNELYGNVVIDNRRQFNFNRIRRVVEMVGGYQRRNRKSTIVVPVENADSQTADQFTKIMMWLNQQEDVEGTISEAFTGSLIAGMNLLQVWMDYREDPISGNIKVSNCSYNSFVIDPYFKKSDLSDCNAIWKRTFLTQSQAISLLPDKEEEVASLYGLGHRDGKFQYMPESYDYNMKNLLAYDEFYYRDYRKQRLVVDTQSGEQMEWPGDEEALEEYLSFYPQVTTIENEIPTVNLAIVVQGRVMYDGPNPMGIDNYPFVPVLAYYTPELPYFQYRVQGIVRGLRDAQFLYNRRKIIELDILESQVNSGWLAKENAFVDPKTPYKTGQGQVLWLKEEAQMTDVQQIQASNVSPSMFQLSESLGQEIQEISGVNEELLGSASDDKAGILAMLRQGAGLTTLQRLFDQLDSAQKLLGKIIVKLIQKNFVPGKIMRIIEEEPTEQFYSNAFGKYDAAVEEGHNTTTQRQLEFAQLLHLREVGVPVPDESILQAATFQNKKDLIEKVTQAQQQQQQEAQAQAQAAMQLQEAQSNLADARSTADRGLGIERMSRVDENQALALERRAEAQKDQDIGLLNIVKAVKEIQDIDIGQLFKLLTLDTIVKQKHAAEAAQQPQINTEMLAQLLAQLQPTRQSPAVEQPPMAG